MAKSLCKCGARVDDADIPTHPCCGVVGDRAKLIADLNRIKVWQQLNPAAALLVRYAAKELADLETENAALRAQIRIADEVDGQRIAEINRLHEALSAECAQRVEWVKLYRRAFNQAAGLTNYVEDRPELRHAEKKLAEIESESRVLDVNHASSERVIKGETK